MSSAVVFYIRDPLPGFLVITIDRLGKIGIYKVWVSSIHTQQIIEFKCDFPFLYMIRFEIKPVILIADTIPFKPMFCGALKIPRFDFIHVSKATMVKVCGQFNFRR